MKKIIAALLVAVMSLGLTACGYSGNQTEAMDLQGLKGKVVYNMPGQGQVTDLVFRYILQQNGIDYVIDGKPHKNKVALAYMAKATDLINALAASSTSKVHYGIVAEPTVTSGMEAHENVKMFLDVQQLYAQASPQAEGWPQAVLAVKAEFLQQNPAYVAAFVQKFKTGGAWLEANPSAGLAAVKAAGSVALTSLTAQTVVRCNIGYTGAQQAKAQFNSFVSAINGVVLQDEGETAIPMPTDAFYAAEPAAEADTAYSGKAQVYLPDGAPALAMAQMLGEGFANAEFHVVKADQIGANMNKNADIGILPSTAAATLYRQTGGKIIMLGISTLGNMYLLKS